MLLICTIVTINNPSHQISRLSAFDISRATHPLRSRCMRPSLLHIPLKLLSVSSHQRKLIIDKYRWIDILPPGNYVRLGSTWRYSVTSSRALLRSGLLEITKQGLCTWWACRPPRPRYTVVRAVGGRGRFHKPLHSTSMATTVQTTDNYYCCTTVQ